MKPKPAALASAVLLASIVGLAVVVATRMTRDRVQCGPGFVATGARCVIPPDSCPSPLVRTARGCDAPRVRVEIRLPDVLLGPSDWEAEGRVQPRTLHVAPFAIDAFEVTRGAFDSDGPPASDLARAASGMDRAEAERFCRSIGGRLPTRDEWIAAALAPLGAAGPRRYPWGDTGAVCRRAAWGLTAGPCATTGQTPDTVGAHPEGDSPLGVHDLAGNVAEWVATPDGADGAEGEGAVRGGSWTSALGTELRTWGEERLSPTTRDLRIGFRCAYNL